MERVSIRIHLYVMIVIMETSGKMPNTFDLVISAIMFGCGMGGIFAAIFALYT